MKLLILRALKEFRQIDSLDFEQEFEGKRFSTNRQSFDVEDYGFSISFDIYETVRWEDHEWNELQEYEIDNFQAWDINGYEIDTTDITEEEILTNLGL